METAIVAKAAARQVGLDTREPGLGRRVDRRGRLLSAVPAKRARFLLGGTYQHDRPRRVAETPVPPGDRDIVRSAAQWLEPGTQACLALDGGTARSHGSSVPGHLPLDGSAQESAYRTGPHGHWTITIGTSRHQHHGPLQSNSHLTCISLFLSTPIGGRKGKTKFR